MAEKIVSKMKANRFAILAMLVLLGAASLAIGADEVVKVPLKVNVLSGVTITDAEIKEIVKEGNKILKPAGVQYANPKIARNVSDQNSAGSDDKIQKGEDAKLDEAGKAELDKDFGEGAGVKIYITNQVHNSDNTNGCAPHVTEDANGNLQGKPVIYLKNRPSDPNKKKGATLAHESAHVFTLGDLDIEDITIDGNTLKIDWSDVNGHSSDPNNLMYPYSRYKKDGNDVDRGTTLTERQKKEILKGAKRHVKKKKVVTTAPKKKETAINVTTVPVIVSGFVDDINEIGVIMPPFADLGAGLIYAESPAGVVEISLLMEGLFDLSGWPEEEISMTYRIMLDTDNDMMTGIPFGMMGVDQVVNVDMFGGMHPGGYVRMTLENTITGAFRNLPMCSTQRIYKIDDKDEDFEQPERTDYVDGVYLEVPMQLLSITADEVPVAVESQCHTTGTVDFAEFVWDIYDDDAPYFNLLTTQLRPGDIMEFEGGNFTPFEPVEISIDGEPIYSMPAEPDGSLFGAIPVPNEFYGFGIDDEYYDYYYVTARELISGREDFSIVELLPEPADIVTDGCVNFVDLAAFATSWLAGCDF